MYNILSNLISKKYYPGAAEISAKVDVFYAMSKITDDEYITLTMQITEMYPEISNSTNSAPESDQNPTESANPVDTPVQ